jgi:hypothetical protein
MLNALVIIYGHGVQAHYVCLCGVCAKCLCKNKCNCESVNAWVCKVYVKSVWAQNSDPSVLIPFTHAPSRERA